MSWIHSHVQGVKCNFSSVDLHTQHTFAKVYKNILGLVVELTEAGKIAKYDFFEMSIEGKLAIEKCSRKKNCQPRVQHESCNNDSYYKSSIEKVIFQDDTSLDCINFMNGRIEASNQSFVSHMHMNDSSFLYLDNNDKMSNRGATGAARAPKPDETPIHCSALPRSILQNPGKTSVLPVLPPMAPLSKSDEDFQVKPSPSGIHSKLYQGEDIIEEGNIAFDNYS